jgi:hypothetical protein
MQKLDRLKLQCEVDNVHAEVTLPDAVFRLADLSQAAVLPGSLPYSPDGFRTEQQARDLLRHAQLFHTDGAAVENDPTYQAPEVGDAIGTGRFTLQVMAADSKQSGTCAALLRCGSLLGGSGLQRGKAGLGQR